MRLVPRRGATSYDVAKAAGVSQSAVSRCYTPGASVAPETRKRILAAAEALGYAPNAIAQGLITRRSNLIGVLISSLTNLYYPEVLAELTRRLGERGARVLLFTLQQESEVAEVLAQLWRYRVDGVIAAARLSAEAVGQFHKRQVPLVLYNRTGEGAPAASVCCDSTAGEVLLIDKLVESGHRRFGVITGPGDSFVSQQRVGAALEQLRRHGMTADVVPGAFDYRSGDTGLRRLMLATDGKLDALVCANDLMAIGALDCARHAFGLKVPDQLSIVGFDGVGPAAWTSYGLTTIRQPVGRMTEAAVAMIAERIENPELSPERRTFEGQFIAGTSARLA